MLCYRFGVRSFRSIQGFNGDDFGSRALILIGTCDFPTVINNVSLAPVRERLQQRIGGFALAAVVVLRWFEDLDVIFIMCAGL